MNETTWLWKLDISIPSHPDEGVVIIRQLLDQLEQQGWNERDVFGIHMAMEEAVMNAIKHGNQRDPDKSVHVLAALSCDRFYAQVTDEGPGFDPEDVPDPTLEENLEKPCGRGLMLMKNFVDGVKFNKQGNSVELTKQRTDSPGC